MKLSRSDWLEIRREALIFLACLPIAAGAVVASYHAFGSADRDLAAAQVRQQKSRAALAKLQAERKEIAAALGPYRELAERSIIGDEQRLQWRTTLEDARRSTGLEQVSYSLSVRQPWPADQAGAASLPRAYRSAMTLKAEFRKETAFVDFLEQISQRAAAIPVVRACDMSRAGIAEREEQGGLKAECIIDWFTLQRNRPDGGMQKP